MNRKEKLNHFKLSFLSKDKVTTLVLLFFILRGLK
jgi:hypothetical protein